MLGAELGDLFKRDAERLNEFRLILHGELIVAATRCVDSEGLFQLLKDIGIVNDEAIHLVVEDSIGAGDRLHERVTAHGLVEIDGRTTWSVEAGEPHGTDKDEAEGVFGVFEFGLEVLLCHPGSVGSDIDPLGFHIADLVLG